MIPTKCGRYSSKTGRTYVHIYSKDEQRKIMEAELEGKNPQTAIKEIIEGLTEDDWQEVTA